jgi:hypothetical protein
VQREVSRNAQSVDFSMTAEAKAFPPRFVNGADLSQTQSIAEPWRVGPANGTFF